MGLLNGTRLGLLTGAGAAIAALWQSQQSPYVAMTARPRQERRPGRGYPYSSDRQHARYARQHKAHNNFGAGNDQT